MFNPLIILDYLLAASDPVRAAMDAPRLPPPDAAEESEWPSEHRMLRGWGLAASSLSLLLAIILVTLYGGVYAAMLVGAAAVVGVIVFVADGVAGRLPPPAARQSVGAGAHLPGPARTGDAAVDAFLDRLAGLNPAEWRRVPLCSLSLAAGLRWDVAVRRAYARARELVDARGSQPACDAIARGVRAALESEESLKASGFWGGAFARMAATALLLRDALSEAQLRALYLPFEPVIPRASLHDAADDARVLDGAGQTPLVVAAHEQSIAEFGEVYRKLAG